MRCRPCCSLATADTGDVFRPGQECVDYGEEDLEAQLEYYLEHEDERQALAGAARERMHRFAFEDLWQSTLAGVEERWPELQERCRRRAEARPAPDRHTRVWQALGNAA